MPEPSVLDYLKSRLMPWRGIRIEIPPAEPKDDLREAAEESVQAVPAPESPPLLELAPARPPKPETLPRRSAWPWRSLLALILALGAQASLEPGPGRTWMPGAVLYGLAVLALLLAYRKGECKALAPEPVESLAESLSVRFWPLVGGGVLALLSFLAFGNNRFTWYNLTLWLASLAFLFYALWLKRAPTRPLLSSIRDFIARPQWRLEISRWHLALLGAIALALFFRTYRLADVPPEMVSDHAEKLLDVSDVLNGQASIYFPRNTGREAFQMYLSAAVVLLFGTGLSFLSLKIGTVLGGLFTLPYIYLLGKEIGNRRIGLWALAFAGIAYWPNLISRIALRFTLYPLFFAPTFYYLVRGLRRSNRNDFILSGVFLGIGLHGYSPFRLVPLLVVVAVILYMAHLSPRLRRASAVHLGTGLLVLAIFSLVIFLPLLRYALENPEMFSYRAMTRLGSLERPLPGPAWQIFLLNLWNALTMFAWDNGEVWVISVTHRPVLDVVSGALFHLGVLLVGIRYLRKRNWFDLVLLLSIPILMLPSILSLAFPDENPSLNRTAGAIVPVFLLIGLALEGLLGALERGLGGVPGKWAAWGLGLLLLFWSASLNYQLVFQQYQAVYRLSSWNTSEMGRVVRDFADSVGSPENAWLVAYPHWADSRLVAINAGYPTRDIALWPEHFADTLPLPGSKLFLINPQDGADLDALRQLYPAGVLKEYTSQVETKDFLVFYVPPPSLPGETAP